jgi:hypothetical protein
VARNRRRIDRVLARVDGHSEWGVRVTFDERAADRGDGSRNGRPTRPETGAAYLSRKRDLRDLAQTRFARARSSATGLYRAMAREVTAARRHKATEQAAGSRVLVDAAFLVPVRRAAAFRSALRREARALETAGCSVAVTGPWPPYNFVGTPRVTPSPGRKPGGRKAARRVTKRPSVRHEA